MKLYLMKIIVDNREKKLHELLVSFLENEEPGKVKCTIEIQQLHLGDIIICDEEDKELLMIERKTPADLAASIKDGRYSEQSFRLSNYKLHNHQIIYLIEGSIERFNDKKSRVKKDALHSALFSVNYFKGYSVMKTTTMIDTAQTILRVVKKLCREKNKNGYYSNSLNNSEQKEELNRNNHQPSNVTEEDYACVVKKEKKLNITPNNIGIIMLSQIPGVSTQSARVIMSNFTSFQDFMENFNKPDFILKKATFITSSGASRKISNTSVQNIKKFLFNNT